MDQMRNSEVIVVDEHDAPIGRCDKYTAHRTGEGAQLHRAFSLFLFDNAGRLLVQQRAAGKLTFPLVWANTCCSHPSPGEDIIAAARRRTAFELGIDLSSNVSLREVAVFRYEAAYGEWVEKEVDHVVFGLFGGGDIDFNKEEVNDIRWVTREELSNDIEVNESKYSPWLVKIHNRWLRRNWNDVRCELGDVVTL